MQRITALVALVTALAAALPSAFAIEASSGPIPAAPALAPLSAAQLETLAIELSDSTMRLFVEGMKQKDLRTLGPMVSLRFKRSYSPEQVNATFAPFFAATVTGDPLANKSPIFLKAPEINRTGLLDVQGFYELPDGLLLFQFAFVREGTGWKLDGLNIRSQPYNAPATNPATSEKPLKFKMPAGRLVEA